MFMAEDVEIYGRLLHHYFPCGEQLEATNKDSDVDESPVDKPESPVDKPESPVDKPELTWSVTEPVGR